MCKRCSAPKKSGQTEGNRRPVRHLQGTAGADLFARERLGWWSPTAAETIEYAIQRDAWEKCVSDEPKPEGKTAGRKTKRGTHAQHIHAHCNCEYAVRFDDSTSVAGYDPDRYLAQYADADGDLNAIRREHYAKHKDLINAQKRAAYAKRRALQAKRIQDAQREHEQKRIAYARRRQKQKVNLNTSKENGIINLQSRGFVVDTYTEEQYQKMLSERSIVHKSQGVRSLPKKGKKDSISDFVLEDGTIDQRRVYGSDGKAIVDYDTSDHGVPKFHPTGAHKHIWNHKDEKPRGKWAPLTDEELMLNSDIIREGENCHVPGTKGSD